MRSVSHDVTSERLDKRDTWIFAAAGTIRPQFVIHFRLKSDTESLDPDRITGRIEQDSRYTDAGVVTPRDQPREKVKLTIRTTRGGWVQDAFGFQRITRLRFHQQSKTPQLEVTHLVGSLRRVCCLNKR
jgi:hypothetical protein